MDDTHFCISRTYSDIPGLQLESRDTYEVTLYDGCLGIKLTCECENSAISEEQKISSISFEQAKQLAVFLSENSVRRNSWLDVLNDYCTAQV